MDEVRFFLEPIQFSLRRCRRGSAAPKKFNQGLEKHFLWRIRHLTIATVYKTLPPNNKPDNLH
jgi:hypothetical protein